MGLRENNQQTVSSLVEYWANVFISAAQVFLGVAAGTFFIGQFDQNKLIVVGLNITIAFIFWILGMLVIKRNYE